MIINDINLGLKTYRQKWNSLTAACSNTDFFNNLNMSAVGWKTEDQLEFDRLFVEIREQCDQVHLGWVNDRWLASMHLKDSELEGAIRIIKLMQRRPGSTDPTGLDHVDFLAPNAVEARKALESESGLKWTEETNNPRCNWLSIWFEGTEAKLREDTVLDVCIAELRETNDTLL